MPEWARAAAVGRALRTRRDWIGGFGYVLWRRKLLILACLGLVLASTAAYVSALTPAYEAEALVASGELPNQQTGQERPATHARHPPHGRAAGRPFRPAALAGVPAGSLLPRHAAHRSERHPTVAAACAPPVAGRAIGGHTCAGAHADRRGTGGAAAGRGDRGDHGANRRRDDGFVGDRPEIHCRGPAGRRCGRERARGYVSRAAPAGAAGRSAKRAREARPGNRAPARRRSLV